MRNPFDSLSLLFASGFLAFFSVVVIISESTSYTGLHQLIMQVMMIAGISAFMVMCASLLSLKEV